MAENNTTRFIETRYTKIFIGGLAWITGVENLVSHFQQFGEIDEAVVIKDRRTRRSKGYGFVTFKDPEAARRALMDPCPVIDGKKTNCNLAYFGAQRNRSRPSIPEPAMGSFAPRPQFVTYQGFSPMGFYQPLQYTFPYSTYGYAAGYLQGNMYPMNYLGVGALPGIFHNPHPFFVHYSQNGVPHGGFENQGPQIIQIPLLPPLYSTRRIQSLPPPVSIDATVGETSFGAGTLLDMTETPETTIEQIPPAQIVGGEEFGFVFDE